MKIKHIELNNFRIQKHLALDFTQRINAIVGENGKGKSTIFKAIDYVIYGESEDSTIAESVKRGETECNVTLVVSYKGIDYTFFRETKLNAKGKGSSNASITFKGNDKIEGSSEVKAFVLENFPSRKLLFASNYAMQNSSDGFIEFTPAERFQEFIKILNLQKWIKRSEKCAELMSIIDSEVLVKETTLSALKEELENTVVVPVTVSLESFKEAIDNKDESISKCTKKKERYTLELNTIKENNDRRETDIKRKESIISYLETYKKSVSEIESYMVGGYEEKVTNIKKDIHKLTEESSKILFKRTPVFDTEEYNEIVELSEDAQFKLRALQQKHTSISNGKCPTCGTEHTVENIKGIEDEINKYKKECEAFIKKIRDFAILKEDIQAITLENVKSTAKQNEILTAIDNKNKDVAHEDEIKKTKQDTLTTLQQNITNNNDELKILEVTIASSEVLDSKVLSKRIQDNNFTLESESLQRDILIKERTEVEIQLKTNQEIAEKKLRLDISVKDTKEEIASKILQKENYTKLKLLFGKTIPMFVILDSLKVIQTAVNTFLLDVYPKHSIQFVEDKQKLHIKVRERNSMNLPFEFTTLSGFEKTITKLAIRLGLSTLSEDTVDSIILDEFDASANSKNSQLTIESIIKLTQKFSQLFVTTHKEQIKSYLESIGCDMFEIT